MFAPSPAAPPTLVACTSSAIIIIVVVMLHDQLWELVKVVSGTTVDSEPTADQPGMGKAVARTAAEAPP
jgi:hypothetical protein